MSNSPTKQKGCCFFCNGFYGPTHGEYICGTCHLFLYADDRNPELVSSVGAMDENDSGNDEPSEGQLSNERYVRVQGQPNRLPATSLGSVQRTLYQRVRELSVGPNNSVKSCSYSENTVSPLFDHMTRLPPEVLLLIFRHLDALSLWSLSIACDYLTNLVQAHMSDDKWRRKTERYWPLYRPLFNEAWYQIFSKLVLSAPCRPCLGKMMNEIDGDTIFDVNKVDCIDNSRRLKRLRHEVNTMKHEPPEGVNAKPIDENYLYWCASIQGPVNSPYEGGIFFLYMQVPYVYPLLPPKVRFITRIFHPNVSRHGDIGLDSIAHNWSLALTIAKILISIQSILTDPYCKVCMEPAIAKLYETDREAFNRKAMEWTYKYAMTDILPLSSYESDDENDACHY